MQEVTDGSTHRNPSRPPWQDRVLTEKKELDEKIQKLKAFLEPITLQGVSPTETERLKQQLQIMQDYSRILGERIANFS